jgi:hypothetical protein
MMILGGFDAAKKAYLSSTQIVRPGYPTEPGPDMTEIAVSQCSTTLQDGSVIVTGGRRISNELGSPKTEIYNFATGEWSRKADMKQRRFVHSCTQVWLNPDDPNSDILIGYVSSTAVLSVVVAGGNLLISQFYCKSWHRVIPGWKSLALH